MEKWEYNLLRYNPVIDRSQRSYEDALHLTNELGEKGWELVSTMEINGDQHFWFKRPKQ
jgi:hypothetical protein